jgi:hypothetical protein
VSPWPRHLWRGVRMLAQLPKLLIHVDIRITVFQHVTAYGMAYRHHNVASILRV